jgi:hypothetical protein
MTLSELAFWVFVVPPMLLIGVGLRIAEAAEEWEARRERARRHG